MVEATARVKVDVPEPGAAMDVGLKVAVTPAGAPDAVRAIAALNPPDTAVVTVKTPLFPCATETEAGEAVSVKAGLAAAVTVSEIVADSVRPPPVPVTVIE